MFQIVQLVFIYILSISNSSLCEYVTIPQLGTIKGSISYTTWTNQTIYQFLNIPYGEAPINELRYQVGFSYFSLLTSNIEYIYFNTATNRKTSVYRHI